MERSSAFVESRGIRTTFFRYSLVLVTSHRGSVRITPISATTETAKQRRLHKHSARSRATSSRHRDPAYVLGGRRIRKYLPAAWVWLHFGTGRVILRGATTPVFELRDTGPPR